MSIDEWKTLNCSEKMPDSHRTDLFIDCLCDSQFLCCLCVHRTVVVVAARRWSCLHQAVKQWRDLGIKPPVVVRRLSNWRPTSLQHSSKTAIQPANWHGNPIDCIAS